MADILGMQDTLVGVARHWRQSRRKQNNGVGVVTRSKVPRSKVPRLSFNPKTRVDRPVNIIPAQPLNRLSD